VRLLRFQIGDIKIGKWITLLSPLYFGLFGLYYHQATNVHFWTIAVVIICFMLFCTAIWCDWRRGRCSSV
jgi:hypothetical protein